MMDKTTEYLLTSIQSNLSALRELNEIDQAGVKNTMATLKFNIEKMQMRKDYEATRNDEQTKTIPEVSRNTFIGVKIKPN